MKKLIMVVMILLCSINIFAQDKLDFSFNADFFSKDIWRGQNVVNEPVFQQSVNVEYKNLTLTGWGNIDLTNTNDNQNNFTELDFSLDYSGKVFNTSNLNYSIGLINYIFPHTECHSTSEVYVGLSLDTFFSPSLTIFRDIDEVDGTYISFGIDHSFKNFKNSLSLGWADGNYNSSYWGKDSSGFNDLTLSLSYPIKLKDWTLSPSISYITLIGDGMRESTIYGKDSDFVVIGFGLSTSF